MSDTSDPSLRWLSLAAQLDFVDRIVRPLIESVGRLNPILLNLSYSRCNMHRDFSVKRRIFVHEIHTVQPCTATIGNLFSSLVNDLDMDQHDAVRVLLDTVKQDKTGLVWLPLPARCPCMPCWHERLCERIGEPPIEDDPDDEFGVEFEARFAASFGEVISE